MEHVYDSGDADYYLVFPFDAIAAFDSATAKATLLEDWDEQTYIDYHGDARGKALFAGADFTAEELAPLRDSWIERERQLGGESSVCCACVVVQHGEPGNGFCAHWTLSGYSFDQFQASFDGLSADREAAIRSLESWGKIIG